MATKRNNKYKICLQEIELKDGTQSGKSIAFEFENHDDILSIIEQVLSRNLFASENDTKEFIVGLKLFSEVMLRNKDNSLFEDCAPAFMSFMKKLKAM